MLFMTVDEVTGLLRCHRITVLRPIRRGRLHTVKIGSALRFARTEVSALNNGKIAMYPHLTVVGGRCAVPTAAFKAPDLTLN